MSDGPSPGGRSNDWTPEELASRRAAVRKYRATEFGQVNTILSGRKTARAKREAKKSLGICTDTGCVRAASDGHIRCAECHLKMLESVRSYRAGKKAK